MVLCQKKRGLSFAAYDVHEDICYICLTFQRGYLFSLFTVLSTLLDMEYSSIYTQIIIFFDKVANKNLFLESKTNKLSTNVRHDPQIGHWLISSSHALSAKINFNNVFSCLRQTGAILDCPHLVIRVI